MLKAFGTWMLLKISTRIPPEKFAPHRTRKNKIQLRFRHLIGSECRIGREEKIFAIKTWALVAEGFPFQEGQIFRSPKHVWVNY